MNTVKTGQIIQINSNNAIVLIDNEYHTCKIKGSLKYNNTTPVVGDIVDVSYINNEYLITNIQPRTSYIMRPSVANVDTIILVQSFVEPEFNFNLLMKYLAYYESFVGQVILVFTKVDIVDDLQWCEFKMYLEALYNDRYKMFYLPDKQMLSKLKGVLKNKTFCLAGNSGVGKTTLINALFPKLNLKTQEISHALNRGKHTTTTTKMIVAKNYKLIDTPGFSSIDVNILNLNKKDLASSYHDFKKIALHCKYSNCLHHHEPFCAIKQAIIDNTISKLRYEAYLKILHEIKK